MELLELFCERLNARLDLLDTLKYVLIEQVKYLPLILKYCSSASLFYHFSFSFLFFSVNSTIPEEVLETVHSVIYASERSGIDELSKVCLTYVYHVLTYDRI